MEIRQQTIELHPKVFVPDGAIYSYGDNQAVEYFRQDLTGNRVLFADIKQKFVEGHQYQIAIDAQIIQGAIGLELVLHQIDDEPKPTAGDFNEIVYKSDAAFHLKTLEFSVDHFIADATVYVYGSGDCQLIVNSILITDVTQDDSEDKKPTFIKAENNFQETSRGLYQSTFQIESKQAKTLMIWDSSNISDWQFIRDNQTDTILPQLEHGQLQFYADIQTTEKLSYQFTFEYQQGDRVIKKTSADHQFSVNFPNDAINPKLVLSAKGQGELTFNQMRVYKDRHGLGYAVPGQKIEKVGGDYPSPLAYYFRPGNKNDKLIVVFSGIQPFNARIEWLGTYTSYDRPLLVFTDSRLFGGTWHLGKRLDPEFQNRIQEIVNSIAKKLNIDSRDIVTIGYSMGSFAAAYYGALLGAGNIISTLPIYKIGDTTSYDHNVWGGSSWVTQTRQFLLGDNFLGDPQTEKLNSLIDDVVDNNIDQLKNNQARVFIFNEKFDELDGYNFEDNIGIWRKHDIPVINSEEYGRHLTHFGTMLEFIKTMLELEILKD